MFNDISKYINTCDTCQRRGAQVRKKMLIPLKVKGIFHCIEINTKGSLSKTAQGN
jgi:hypothetical protein